MAFNDLKITTADINTNNVKSAADTYSADDIQRNKDIFDRLPELIAARVNGLIDRLTEELAGIYTKTEVVAAINNKIVEIGTGDMAKGVYDTDGDGKVNAADTADKLADDVKIGDAEFDGSKDITLAEMGAVAKSSFVFDAETGTLNIYL